MKHFLSKKNSHSFKNAVQNSTVVRQKFFRNFAICFQAPLVHCRAPLPLRILQNIGAFYGKSTSSGIKYYNLKEHRKGSNFRQASCGHKLAPQGYGERVFTSPWFLKELLSHPSVDFWVGLRQFLKKLLAQGSMAMEKIPAITFHMVNTLAV